MCELIFKKQTSRLEKLFVIHFFYICIIFIIKVRLPKENIKNGKMLPQ
jgi:hypothetical protein